MRNRTRIYTPIELRKWEDIREGHELFNPKTGKTIVLNGPTYIEIEIAYQKYKCKRDLLCPDESKLAAPKTKVERVLAHVIETSAFNNDVRTAAKIGMINRSLQDDFIRYVPTSIMQRRDFVFHEDIVRRLLHDSVERCEFNMQEPSGEVIEIVMKFLSDRVKYVRDLTRIRRLKTLIKPNDMPRREETLKRVSNKFRRFHPCNRTIGEVVDTTLKLQGEEAIITPLYNEVKDCLYDFFDVRDEIAMFFARYVNAYISIMVEYAANRSFQQGLIGPIIITREDLYTFEQN